MHQDCWNNVSVGWPHAHRFTTQQSYCSKQCTARFEYGAPMKGVIDQATAYMVPAYYRKERKGLLFRGRHYRRSPLRKLRCSQLTWHSQLVQRRTMPTHACTGTSSLQQVEIHMKTSLQPPESRYRCIVGKRTLKHRQTDCTGVCNRNIWPGWRRHGPATVTGSPAHSCV